MSDQQTQFRYLIITQHREVGMISGLLSVDGTYVASDEGFYSFWTEKSPEDLFDELSRPGKGFAMIRVDGACYNHVGGQLSGVLDHIK